MRVAIIPPTGKTGEWTLSRHLIAGLRARGVDVKELRHFALSRPNVKIFLGSLLLKRLIEDDSFSIIHNVDNLGPFLFRHRDLPAKKVLTVHDIAPLMVPEYYKRVVPDRVMRFDFAIVLPKLIENCDLTIVDSYSTMTDLIEKFGVPKDKLTVVHLGVDTSLFHPYGDYSQVMRKYNLRSSYLLYVGDDGPRKNLKTLIRAYMSIFQDIPDDLVLIGPINENKIRAYINSSDFTATLKKYVQERIVLPGYTAYDDLPSLYSGATALVFPSLYEGFGLTPLEAMACGTIAVVSNNSSLKEVVGGSGILINDPLDPEEISARILQALEKQENANDWTRRGLEHVQQFTWQKTVQKTIAAYDKVMSM